MINDINKDATEAGTAVAVSADDMSKQAELMENIDIKTGKSIVFFKGS